MPVTETFAETCSYKPRKVLIKSAQFYEEGHQISARNVLHDKVQVVKVLQASINPLNNMIFGEKRIVEDGCKNLK